MHLRKFVYTIIIAAILIISGLIAVPVNAQTDPLQGSLKSDTTGTVKSRFTHNVYATAGLGYNLVYMGTSLSQDKPYYSGGLVYGLNSEFFISAYSVHLNAYDPLLSFSAFSLSYSHTFNSWFDIALSSSRYQVNRKLEDTLFASFFYGDLTLGFDWKILYTKISAGGLIADDNAAFLQVRNSRYFRTREFSKAKAYFSFDPFVNLLFGTMIETVEGTVIPPPYKGGRNKYLTTYATKSGFGLLEIEAGLPVSFEIKRYTIEAEPGYSIPLQYPGNKGFIFSLGLYVRIL